MNEITQDTHARLARVVIGIAAFRSDDQILALLGKVFAHGAPQFAGVVVVDSLSDGRLAKEIAAQGWRVTYENADYNLGAAGNLERRLRLAAALDADWCFAINHDGSFDPPMISALAARGSVLANVGAMFPRRVLLDRGNSSFRPITAFFGTATHMPAHEQPTGDVAVAWDSSNGALYALAPVRKGVRVPTELWHGWEDLAYSWELDRAGWKQYRCEDVLYLDDYEYQRVALLGRAFHIARKPPWYAYYLIRNLMLTARHTRAGWTGRLFIANRIAREIAFTVLFRTEKLKRLATLGRGFLDGMAGRTGRGPVP